MWVSAAQHVDQHRMELGNALIGTCVATEGPLRAAKKLV